jgi:hypothetical protein
MIKAQSARHATHAAACEALCGERCGVSGARVATKSADCLVCIGDGAQFVDDD